ncbi:hypothetical protein ABZZ36_37780 [Actinacidiphila glaucinigra]|uniref:hypothetical protein n=1 Tax=Actinacidiphila glaucinigra TaxID=235986 RepID=UPI0033A51328
MSHDAEEDFTPPANPRMVEAVLQGPDDEVALLREWIEFRAAEVRSLLVDLPDGTVRCRMYVVTREA